MDTLVELATRLCAIDVEARDIKQKMLAVLTGNGADHNPLPFASPSRSRAPPRFKGKTRQGLASAEKARSAENLLVRHIQSCEGATVGELMRLTSGKRAATQDRLKRLMARGAVEKRSGGGWWTVTAPAASGNGAAAG